jgi:hypothetical protein
MSSKTALKTILAIVAVVTLFHMAIILKFIPYEITWGGRLKNDNEMYAFESISIIINLILAFTLLIKGNYIKQLISIKTVNIVLWVFLILFGINTIGNLFAETLFEKTLSLLTLALSLLIWKILHSDIKQA